MKLAKQTPAVRLFALQLIIEMLKELPKIQGDQHLRMKVETFGQAIQRLHDESKLKDEDDIQIASRITNLTNRIEDFYRPFRTPISEDAHVENVDIVWH